MPNSDRDMERELSAELRAWGYHAETLSCGHEIWGTPGNIDSGLRKHIEHCPDYPHEEIEDIQLPEGESS